MACSRFSAVFAVGLLCSGLGSASGQHLSPVEIPMVVMVHDEDVVSRSQVGMIFASMEEVLADEGCAVQFVLESMSEIPPGIPPAIGSPADYQAVSQLGAVPRPGNLAVVLTRIEWCPVQSRPGVPVSRLAGVGKPHLGCSFGTGFAAVVGLEQTPIAWLHELGHVKGLEHMNVPGFVMSGDGGSVGGQLAHGDCAVFST